MFGPRMGTHEAYVTRRVYCSPVGFCRAYGLSGFFASFGGSSALIAIHRRGAGENHPAHTRVAGRDKHIDSSHHIGHVGFGRILD